MYRKPHIKHPTGAASMHTYTPVWRRPAIGSTLELAAATI